ncbi:MAG: hypothetical protein QXL14_00555, partial [Candidatus Aenigmatarchaeota archaeon]
DFLEVKPYAIEIHPGKSQRNNIKVFSKAIKRLYDAYKNRYNEKVLIFIENRTRQYIQDGEDINDFWMLFKNRYPNLTGNVGIILDIQQLYTVTQDNFISEFEKIPQDSLFGLHIHTRHRTPSIDDKIPWKFISTNLKQNRLFHILPEFIVSRILKKTYLFCKETLNF